MVAAKEYITSFVKIKIKKERIDLIKEEKKEIKIEES